MPDLLDGGFCLGHWLKFALCIWGGRGHQAYHGFSTKEKGIHLVKRENR